MHIHNLTPSDLEKHPVWYFSSDDDVTIEPLSNSENPYEYPIIVKTNFTDTSGKRFVGFIHYSKINKINYIFPLMFIGENGDCEIYFWNGMFEPDLNSISVLKNNCILPIEYASEEVYGLFQLKGKIEGIYYLDKEKKVRTKV